MEERRERLADTERIRKRRTDTERASAGRDRNSDLGRMKEAGRAFGADAVSGRSRNSGTGGRAGERRPSGQGRTVRKKKSSGQKRNKMWIVCLGITVLALVLGLVRLGVFRDAAEAISTSAKLRSIQHSDQWKEIFDHAESYPDVLLRDLERNPEMLDYVTGYPGAERTVQGGLTEAEKQEDCPLLIQWDKRWGYVPYGSYNVGISGCGPTCLSMMIFSFTRDSSMTPDVMARIAEDGGYYVKGEGTAWSLMTDAAYWYGFSVSQETFPGELQIKDSLDQGAMLICSMGPGDFTDNGHFILITGYDDDGFTVNDPFSYENSGKSWSYEKLAPQVVQTWTYTAY